MACGAPAFVAGLAAFAPADAAQPGHLSGKTIHELVSGATINMHTPVGTVIPVTYAVDGTLSGRTSGIVAYYLGASSDRGQWWIRGRKLCHKWNIWFDRAPTCIAIRRQGRKFHWRDGKGKTGVATIAKRGTVTAAPAPAISKRFRKPYSLGAAAALPETGRPVIRAATPVKRVAPTPRRARARAAPAKRHQPHATPRIPRPLLPVRPVFRNSAVRTSSWTMRKK